MPLVRRVDSRKPAGQGGQSAIEIPINASIPCPAISLVSFRSEKDTRPVPVTRTWPELVKRLQKFTPRTTKGGPMWSPAVYRKDEAGKLLPRKNEHVEFITAGVFDLDQIPDFEGLREGLRATGLAYVLHSTYRCTPEAPRARLVIPFTKPVPADRWRAVCANIHAHLSFLGAEVHADPARAFFFPQCPPDSLRFAEEGEGVPLDWETLPEAPERPHEAMTTSPSREITLDLVASVASAFTKLSPSRSDGYRTWIEAGMAAREIGPHGLALWETWSRLSPKFVEGECQQRWATFDQDHGDKLTVASIFRWAQDDQANGTGSEAEPPSRRAIFSADELLDAEFPEPRWAIPGIIPEGLSLLVGRPKIGKSWYLLQAALAVGSGGRFMDENIDRGKVYYFALEDSPKRLQARMRAIAWPRGVDVVFFHDLLPIGGSLAGLPAFIEVQRPTLIAIDTLSRATQGADQRSISAMTMALGAS
ncbi:MAG: AAA family ATPase, partial [Dehalococcoidia bacterium]|nr:AAA family ATPase [Dehalococcoidia bacterium]